MAHDRTTVKTRSRQIADWIDCHPRSGWYITVWTLLVTSNALIGWLDRILHFIT